MSTPHRIVIHPPVTRLRLGDAVSAVAKPIATAVDAALGTHLATCAPCAARRRFLNGRTPATAAESALTYRDSAAGI